MPVSRLLDGAKLIEPQKGIQITGISRISQFADFAQAIMNRYLVKSVYEFSSASFVFADWFHEEREPEEKQRMERDILRLLRLVKEYGRGKQLPGVYKQLIHQLNRTVMVYENRLGQKSRELLLLCREVSRQGDNASKYLRELETERRFAWLVIQAAGSANAAPVSGTMFTGRFRPELENRIRGSGRIPSYGERFLNAKKESTERFRQVFTERMSVLRFIEGLEPEEKEQIQSLFPALFPEHRDMASVVTSMSREEWKEWKEQVLAMLFPEKEQRPFLVKESGENPDFSAKQPGLANVEEAGLGDRGLSREQELTAGKQAFLSVFSGAEPMGAEPMGTESVEQTLEAILNGSETEWMQTERIFLEMSGGEEVRQLQAVYQEAKRTFEEQIRTGKQENPANDRLTSEFAARVLKLEEPDSTESRTNDQSMEQAAGKLALLMTISELYGGRNGSLKQMLPELTEVLEYSGEDWEKAQTVLLRLEKSEPEQKSLLAWQTNIFLPEKKLSPAVLAWRKPLMEQILRMRNEQEIWKEIQKEYSREKEAYVRKIQEQNGTIPEEMKPVLGKAPFLLMMQNREEAVEMVTGLFYELPELKMYTGGLSGETDQKKKVEWLGEAIASLDAAEWKRLERRFFGKAWAVTEDGQKPGTAGQKTAVRQETAELFEVPDVPVKSGGPEAADIRKAPEDLEFPVMEYQQKKTQILEQIHKESGAIPEDMLAVIGKLPLIQLVKESKETAEYVSRMLYQMPEMEIYTRQWKQQKRKERKKTPENPETAVSHSQAVEILTELIETLNQKEWKLVEDRFLRETEKAAERSRKAGDGLRTGLESGNIPKAPAKTEEERENDREESKLEYWKIENILLQEPDKIPDRYEGTISSADALERLNLPESAALEFLNLLFPGPQEGAGKAFRTEMRQRPGSRETQALGMLESPQALELSLPVDVAKTLAPQVFLGERSHGMIQESGIYAAGQAANMWQLSEVSPNIQSTASVSRLFSTEQAIQAGGFSESVLPEQGLPESVFLEQRLSEVMFLEQRLPEYDFPGYDSGLPTADRVIARTLPPKGIPSPANDAKMQLQFLQEQPAGKLSEEDIRTVQVMGNKIRTENEYEERLTKLVDEIKIQKEEIDKLAASQRKLNDPRRQQRIIDRMMKQLRGQLRLERLRSGID